MSSPKTMLYMLFQLVTLPTPVEAARVPYLSPSAGEVNSARRTCSHHYRLRTWVSAFLVRVLTLDLLEHVTRRLLSYLAHQDTTPFHRNTRFQTPVPIHRKKVVTKNDRSRAHLQLRSSSWVFWTPHNYLLIGDVVSFV